MSGIGAAFHWDGRPVSEEQMRRMMRVVTHRGPDRLRWELDGSAGLAQGLLALRRVELREPPQPTWLPDRSAAVVADCRIDHRDDLCRSLGEVAWLRGTPSDAELILAAYERWKIDLVQHILGDFAFVIWDAQDRRVIAARDPFGVRPLFYHWSPERLLLASEPKQILVLPEIPVVVDKIVAGEFLFRKFEDLDRTFFTAVCRLRPAHLLVATADGVRTVRYWRPDPTREARFDHPREVYDRFRELFLQAVRARLTTDYPVAMHLSGGHDSSAVVSAAAELAREDSASVPRLAALSQLFPGLACDESPYIDAMKRRIPFAAHAVNPTTESMVDGLIEDLWRIDSAFVDLQRGGRRAIHRLVNAMGARTLLTGLGGDELVHEEYYLRDLALQRRFVTLLWESWKASRYSWNSFPWLLSDAFRPLVPRWLKAARRRIRPRGPWSPPDWANRTFLEFFASCPEVPIEPNPGFRTLVQEWAFRWLNYPGLSWALEAVEAHAAADGFSVSHPFLDRPLAEYVISLRTRDRLPSGRWKNLVREGLTDLLPEEIRERRRKTMFDAFTRSVLTDVEAELVEPTLTRKPWLAAEYVDQQRAIELSRRLRAGVEADAVAWETLWRIVMFELWLGQAVRYTSGYH